MLSKDIPIIFPTCRFCGNTIINSNFKIYINKKDKYLQIHNPTYYCREIDGHKYYISCCKDCLLEHFKDDPPKAEKYYFMKANKYGQYCYGYTYDEYKKICSMTVGVTYKAMINKWGVELGEKKWKEYCDKHSKIASKESFIEKYGKEDGLRIYHESRAITKNGMIKKYGEELGNKKWKDYCDRQRYTCSLEYFIKEYGEELGKEKYNNFCEQRITKGGWIHKSFSQESNNLFNIIDIVLKKYNIRNYLLFGKNEKYVRNETKDIGYKLDFYDSTKNLIIEFQGDYWHANPNIYDDKFFNKVTQLYSTEIWEYDMNKKEFIIRYFNNPVYLEIWENDYKTNKLNVVNSILKYYDIQLSQEEFDNIFNQLSIKKTL